MESKGKHKELDRILKRNIRSKIKQILQKRQPNQRDCNGDSLEKRHCHERNWENKIQEVIFDENMFNELRITSKSNDKRITRKKNKRHFKKVEPTNVVKILHEPSSRIKTHRDNEVKGSIEAPWHLYYDGASVKSSKDAGAGATLQNLKHHTLDEFARYIGPQTMHVAEYVGLLGGLRLALNWNVNHLCCYGDSCLVYNQVKGLWKTRTFKMAFLCFHVQEFLKLFKSVKFVHITRKKNLHAAMLAHEAINIHWDRMAWTKSQDEESNQKKKNKENGREDSDTCDFEDDYYNYKQKLKRKNLEINKLCDVLT